MNSAETSSPLSEQIDASCRVPLLALFGGAALWLVLGLGFALAGSLTFHKPDMFAGCAFMTYGNVVAAANNLLLYGFVMPAGLGVMLWILARLSHAELALPLVTVGAAHLWHAGVLIGTGAILTGYSSGYAWLEFPRFAAALIGVAFVLIALSAVATFGLRKERELYPSHWFFLAALLWFPWIYTTANLFLVSTHPVRGVAQATVNWWFVNNLTFVWLGLVGLGAAFYFLPKLASRPLHSRFYALFAFWTLILFGTWLGVPSGAPVPAWLPVTSQLASLLLPVTVLAVLIILKNFFFGAKVACYGGTFCYVRFGTLMFVASALMLTAIGCPIFASTLEFSWFGVAQAHLHLLGFATMVLLGAMAEILPRVTGCKLPLAKLAVPQFFLSFFGVLLYIVPLAVGGVKHGASGYDPAVMKVWLQTSTLGLTFLLLSALLLLVNVFVMTIQWKIGLVKTVIAAVTAPLPNSEVKP